MAWPSKETMIPCPVSIPEALLCSLIGLGFPLLIIAVERICNV